MSEEIDKSKKILYGILANTKTIKQRLDDIKKENDLRYYELRQKLLDIESHFDNNPQEPV